MDFDHKFHATKFLRTKVLEVAADFPALKFAMSHQNDHHTELSGFGVSVNALSPDKPLVTATVEGVRYKMLEDFSLHSFRLFLKKLVDGDLEAVTSATQGRADGGLVKADHCYSDSVHQHNLHLQKQLDIKDEQLDIKDELIRQLMAENEKLKNK